MRERIGKIIRRHNRRQIRIYFFTLVAIAIGLVVIIQGKTIQNADNAAVAQIQDRQLIIARAGVSAIELFIKSIKSEILILKKLDAVVSLNEKETRKIFSDFLKQWKDTPVVGIARVDQDGKLFVLANKEGVIGDEGKRFEKEEHLILAENLKDKDRILVSTPFISPAGASRGKFIIIVYAPVYSKDKFAGNLSITILLDKFKKEFIDPVKLRNDTNVFLTDSNGKFIDGNNKLLAKNIDEYVSDIKWAGSGDEDQGAGVWKFQYPNDLIGQQQIVAFKSISLGNNGNSDSWKLIITNPKDLTLFFLSPILFFQKLGLILAVVFFILGGILFVFMDDITLRDGYLKGYKEAIDELKQTLTRRKSS